MPEVPDQLTEEDQEELTNFSAAVAEPRTLNLPEGTNYITTAIVKSEAGDSECGVWAGALSPREIARRTFESEPEWWMSPEYISLEDYTVYVISSPNS